MSISSSVYLDYNSTTPVDPRVLEKMLPFFSEKFGNAASRNHRFGWEAEEAVEQAQEQVAALIGANPREITFTSGATEANNLALKGADLENGDQIISCASEHKAVLDPIRSLGEKIEKTFLAPQENGYLNLDRLSESISLKTKMITVMSANNETGVIQPIAAITEMARRAGALSMTDATQTVGKVPLDVKELCVDLMSFSAHKMYGPKGVGALYIRCKSKVEMETQIEGGGHQRGLRSGTLNVPGIVGFGAAAELCKNEMDEEGKRLKLLRNKLENGLLKISGTKVNGTRENRMPHVTNISFENVIGEKLTIALNDVAVSHGSACTSATTEPSHVLKAMGISDELALSSLRFSLGRFTTEEEIDFAIRRIGEVVSQLRSN